MDENPGSGTYVPVLVPKIVWKKSLQDKLQETLPI